MTKPDFKKYTHVVWDFNGTVLNDVGTGLVCANELLSRHGLPKLSSIEAYRNVFGFPIIDYYRRLGFDFERFSYAELAKEWVALYLEHVPSAPIYDGVRELNAELRGLGLTQMLISATEERMLRSQLADLGIGSLFDGVLGLDNIHAYSKTELVARWMSGQAGARVILLGDTLHDADTAKAVGADCALIASGHQPASTLAASGFPVYPSIGELL